MSRAMVKPSREVSTNLPVELLALGEGNGMDEDVEAPVALLPGREHALDVGVLLDIAGLHEIGAKARPQAA